jgi:CelD/BcsL family acetyltransferase involved in cellulose biosynthesis
LTATPDATTKRAFGAETRKKLRSKERKLKELGEVRHVIAAEPDMVERVLTSFFAQKRERFQHLGIANPFDELATQAFLRAGCLAGLSDGAPAIELHALMAGEEIVATFGGAVDETRFCGMFNSFDSRPETARSSPGELLLMRIIEAQCRKGREVFDLGVGEAAYKNSVCDGEEPLVDVTIGVSARGRLYSVAADRLSQAKRFIKRTPWAWTLARRLRELGPKRANT